MAERFYCAGAGSNPGGLLRLEGDEAHHLGRVRRIGVGEVVEVFDGSGFATRAEVVALGKRRAVELRPVGPPLPDRPPRLNITLATAIPRGERFDWLVEKAAELGVGRLVPMLTERSVVDPQPSKLARMRRTTIEAAKQCGRNRLLTIDAPMTWNAMLDTFAGAASKLLADPGGLAMTGWPKPDRGADVVVAVGPEGGFSAPEREAAAAAGWVRVGLGPHVLRVETAGLAASARLFALEELGNHGEGRSDE